MNPASQPVEWSPRWPPLEPLFVVARRELVRPLLERTDFTKVRGLVTEEFLALTGTHELPWVDGAQYFGRDGAASWLLVPTQRAPSIPTAWLERRFRAEQPSLDWPCLLLDGALLPVGRAAPLDRHKLELWSTSRG
ncbi:MAG: hypothetical protein QM817_38240 [Archangium sp.]